MNKKDERIAKLFYKGLSAETISKKIGDSVERVKEGLARKKLVEFPDEEVS